MAYRLSRAADEDYFSIYRFTCAEYGVQQGERYLDELDRALDQIARHPRLARIREGLAGDARASRVGAHIVIYVVEDGDDVLILRIRHAREDWLQA